MRLCWMRWLAAEGGGAFESRTLYQPTTRGVILEIAAASHSRRCQDLGRLGPGMCAFVLCVRFVAAGCFPSRGASALGCLGRPLGAKLSRPWEDHAVGVPKKVQARPLRPHRGGSASLQFATRVGKSACRHAACQQTFLAGAWRSLCGVRARCPQDPTAPSVFVLGRLFSLASLVHPVLSPSSIWGYTGFRSGSLLRARWCVLLESVLRSLRSAHRTSSLVVQSSYASRASRVRTMHPRECDS